MKEKKQIILADGEREGRKGIVAHYGNRTGFGPTPSSAIGNLIINNSKLFGITIYIEKKPNI